MEDLLGFRVAQGSLNSVWRVLSHIANQALEFLLNRVEDEGHRSLLDRVVVLQRPVFLDPSGWQATALRSSALWALAHLVLLDVSFHHLTVESQGLLLGELIWKLTSLRLDNVGLVNTHDICETILLTVSLEVWLLGKEPFLGEGAIDLLA